MLRESTETLNTCWKCESRAGPFREHGSLAATSDPHSCSASVINNLLRAPVPSHKTRKPLADCRGILVQPNRNAPLLVSRTALYHQSLKGLEFAWLPTDSAAASFQVFVTRNPFSHRVPSPSSKRRHFFSIPRSLIQSQKSLDWINNRPSTG